MRSDRRVALLDAIFILDQDERMAYNGANRYVVTLHRLLCELGYEPHLWQAGSGRHEFEGIEVEGLPYGEVEYGTQPELNLEFYERTAGYDRIIYLAPMLTFPRTRPRAVAIAHGVFWDYPTQPWATLSGPYKEEWMRRLHFAVTAPDLLVSVDTNTLNWIRATWPGHESRQAHIPNFVDLDLYHPAESGGDRIVVLYPRRLDPGRGIDDAKAAALILTSRHARVEFHFVGRGVNDEIEAEMRRWAEEHPGCRYYWVPMREMPAVYRGADIVIVPSRACEGTSLSCLEAMASGKAVVCSRVGGLSDLVIDGYNGRLIDVTPETLAGAIDELVRDPEKRRGFGARARETARAFSLAEWKKRWARVLRAVWGDAV